MNPFFLFVLLVLNFSITQAAGIPPSEITSQQNDQTLCFQQRIGICIKKLCQANKAQNCVKICEQTIKNECRYAGE